MEEFKDFFKELRERVSSPFIGSFLVSWFVINHNIIIGILFNNADTLKQDRYIFLRDLVVKNSDDCKMIWFPLAFAILYTIVAPIIRYGVKWYIAYIAALSDHKILTSTKNRSVSLTKYAEMLEELKKTEERFESVFANQTSAQQEMITLKNNLQTQVVRNSDLMKEITELNTEIAKSKDAFLQSRSKNNSRRLADHYRGKWSFNYRDSTEVLNWQGGTYEISFDKKFYSISSILYDEETMVVSFVLLERRPLNYQSETMLSPPAVFVFKVMDNDKLISPDGVTPPYEMRKISDSPVGVA